VGKLVIDFFGVERGAEDLKWVRVVRDVSVTGRCLSVVVGWVSGLLVIVPEEMGLRAVPKGGRFAPILSWMRGPIRSACSRWIVPTAQDSAQ